MIDYIDEDVGYLLGMIYARGEFQESANLKSFKIELENKSLQAEGINLNFTHETQIIVSLSKIRERISELLEVEIRQDIQDHSIILYAHFTKSTIGWRDLRFLTNYKFTHKEFILPDFFFTLEKPIKEQFLKGFCDVAGYIRKSNNDRNGFHRIYLQIPNRNWILPIQICHLLQVDFKIPVDTIQWGHPNTREPNITDVDISHTGWAREHQIKIYANDFTIGFGFDYKQKILEEFAEFNLKNSKKPAAICYPNKKSKSSIKPKHPCESSDFLPVELQGKHFDGYRAICKTLGCKQRKQK